MFQADHEYVPYLIRSDHVLDPSHADDPLPASREATNITRGRKAYIRGQEPASYGQVMENHVDPMNTLNDNKVREGALGCGDLMLYYSYIKIGWLYL